MNLCFIPLFSFEAVIWELHVILSVFCMRRARTVWLFPKQFDMSLESLKIRVMFPSCIILFSTGSDGDGWSSSNLLKHSSRNSLAAYSVFWWCFFFFFFFPPYRAEYLMTSHFILYKLYMCLTNSEFCSPEMLSPCSCVQSP